MLWGRFLIYGSLLCVRLRRGPGQHMPADHCAVMSSPAGAYHYSRHAAISAPIPQAPTETDTHLEAQTSCSQPGRTQTWQPIHRLLFKPSLLANHKCFSAFQFLFIVIVLHVCAVPRFEGFRCQLPQVLLPWARERERGKFSANKERASIDTALCKHLTPKDFRTQSESSCIIHCRWQIYSFSS